MSIASLVLRSEEVSTGSGSDRVIVLPHLTVSSQSLPLPVLTSTRGRRKKKKFLKEKLQ